MSTAGTLLLSLSLLLAVAHVSGWVMHHLGQPRVLGEMLTGVILGPSVFGAITPTLQARLFPPATVGQLATVATVGAVMFTMMAGLQLDRGTVARLRRQALAVNSVSALLPAAVGILVAAATYGRLAGASASPLSYSLVLA